MLLFLNICAWGWTIKVGDNEPNAVTWFGKLILVGTTALLVVAWWLEPQINPSLERQIGMFLFGVPLIAANRMMAEWLMNRLRP